MTRAALALLALLAAGPAMAQDGGPAGPGPWAFGAITGLNLSQSSFSSNWAGGDRGAIVWVVSADLDADRQFTRAFNMSNTLQMAYGQTSKQAPDPSGKLTWDTPDKTTDLIAFESVGRFTLDRFVDPYFSLGLNSQFLDQSSPFGEIQFNPIKLKETAGIARILRRTDDAETLTRLGFGFRQTLGRSIVASTLERERFTTNDGGFEWQTDVKQPVLGKKVLYKGQLLVFMPVFYSKSDGLASFDAQARTAFPGRESVSDFWKAPDVSFKNSFTAAITDFLSVNLYAQLAYDKFDTSANVDPSQPLADQIPEIDRNVRKAGQFKQTLSLGLSYRLY